jgi:hypothetical protein
MKEKAGNGADLKRRASSDFVAAFFMRHPAGRRAQHHNEAVPCTSGQHLPAEPKAPA